MCTGFIKKGNDVVFGFNMDLSDGLWDFKVYPKKDMFYVGFKVGGIPEMIDHKKSGYVAEYRSAEDLAEGIWWTLTEADYATLSANAVRKVQHSYSQSAVASRYMEVYNQAAASKHYKI